MFGAPNSTVIHSRGITMTSLMASKNVVSILLLFCLIYTASPVRWTFVLQECTVLFKENSFGGSTRT